MRRLAAMIALVACAAFAAPAAGVASAGTGNALGDIPLVDQNGSAFHLRDLAGHPAAITFVATRCQDTCPIVNAVFSRLAQTGTRVPLVTISLDPAYDTPFVMASFAREMQARTPVWRFLTGRPADIARVLHAFGVTLERGKDGVPDAHSDFIYVLDHRGQLAKTLPLSTNSVTQLRTTLASSTL
jgi:protein SCO1